MIYDLTLPVSPRLPVWPGDPPVELERIESMDAGAHANVSRLACSAHAGTHVDAPHHFLNDGRTVDTLSLEVLTGPCYVAQLPDEIGLVTADVLDAAGLPAGVRRLLLRTRNSNIWARGVMEFQTDFVAISADGADWLVMRGVHLIGVDYLSVAPFKQSEATHRSLLGAGLAVVEGLDLSKVARGNYTLYCLPLKLVGSDGAPARVILID